ncbi:hypothetical protein GCM10025867_46680 (plasmid) [Frondihabitans sucicola]|uniref:Uncharacterized protein n=1 Tax=Frondihabitans sucicola TaxID=1268041 RepID=A0ABM8GVC7_9MICO|nr:hypothetical protein GCM10025867_46680 [Frondihabitans sucicola]
MGDSARAGNPLYEACSHRKKAGAALPGRRQRDRFQRSQTAVPVDHQQEHDTWYWTPVTETSENEGARESPMRSRELHQERRCPRKPPRDRLTPDT